MPFFLSHLRVSYEIISDHTDFHANLKLVRKKMYEIDDF